jgi:hypothetical protein
MPGSAGPTRDMRSGLPTAPHPWRRGSAPLALEIKSFQFLPLFLPVESGVSCLGRVRGPRTKPSTRMKLRAQAQSILSKS